MDKMKHLSVVDGAFLHMESPEMPMHVGSLHLFEPPAGYKGNWHEAVKAHVAQRMHLAPVFTRKLALMPFDLANPVWIPGPRIPSPSWMARWLRSSPTDSPTSS